MPVPGSAVERPELWGPASRMGRSVAVALALSMGGAAWAGGAPSVDGSQDAQGDRARPAASTPRATPRRSGGPTSSEGIQAWVDRFDGDVPEPEVQEALAEDVAERLVERALADHLDGLDIPTDYYDDPARVLTGDPLQLDAIDLAAFDLPIEINDEVKKWMRLLLGPYRKYFSGWLARSSRYEALIHAEADALGMPRDLLYLSMIESGFNPNAYSHAHAAGLWQFIPSTGRMYGLEVDFWRDDRRDPQKSTQAALAFLGRLHDTFGDWYLAFAAYNTGPGRVRRALRSLGDEAAAEATYWTLTEQELIPRETRGYVPKILAAAIIAKHRDLYGFDEIAFEPAFTFDSVTIDGAVDVAVLASCAGIDEDAFRLYNPSIRRFATPEGTYDIRIPSGTAEAFETALAAVPPSERRRLVMHRVASGETLGTIAASYGTTVSALVDTNRITNPNRVAIGQKLIIPVHGEEAPPSDAGRPTRAPAAERPREVTVQRGDTLSGIAERHGLTVSALQSMNALDDAHRLTVGQTLRLVAPADPPRRTATTASSGGTYTVRPGDALSVIAERLGVTQRALLAANDLDDPSRLTVGQVLTVPSASGSVGSGRAPARTYTVRKGDALSRIAASHGVSVSDLVRWNGLSSAASIQIGQVLSVSAGASTPSSKASSSQAPPRPPATYTVRSGDTLSGIAARFSVPMAALRSANDLASADALRVGQVLTLPSGTASEGGGLTMYTVRPGDSLGAIAARHGTTVAELSALNGLRGTTIHPGDVLKVRAR